MKRGSSIARSADNFLHLAIGIYVFALGVFGFALNFYLRPLGFAPLSNAGPIYPGVVFHGVLFTLWMGLAVWQPWQVRRARLDIHRSTGKLATLLAICLVLSGIYVGVIQAARWVSEGQRAGAFSLPIVIMLAFAISFALAIRFRTTPKLHKGWIVIAHCHLLEPPGARALLTLGLPVFPLILILISLPLLFGIAWEAIKNRRIGWLYLGGLAFVQVAGFARHALANDPRWIAFVEKLFAAT